MDGGTWSLGYAAREIMPDDLGQNRYFMSGYGANKPVTGVYEPLYVRAALISAGETAILFLVFDLTGMARNDVQAIRTAVVGALGGAVDAVHLLFTHSHAAIDTMGLWGDLENGISGRDETYIELCRARAVEAAQAAAVDMRTGTLSFGQTPGLRDAVMDIRSPAVSDSRLTRLRFRPDDGSAETVILHFNCHPETLGGENTLISPDYPAELIRRYEEKSGARALFFNGCVGGMQTVPIFRDGEGAPLPLREQMLRMGRMLASAALAIQDSELPPFIDDRSAAVTLPMENPAFQTAVQRGILNQPLSVGEGNGYVCETELGVTILGGLKWIRVPGELFPELLLGGMLRSEDCANPNAEAETALCRVFGADALVLGLCDDEIGYILPENDFYLDASQPYIARGIDRFGRRHYEETNSLGPQTARRLISALTELWAAK